ncbi:MAG: transketolase C-terminal domain-containing protein [Candidatus Pacebacteria bacterium]|nr:transketolase C-terminal domain-containing protein [Candidatus Paceibacterota bacterium]MDP7466280.1 transketolase C-terminal domain-containing protein [Candidatus Paceibacterota bacterium]
MNTNKIMINKNAKLVPNVFEKNKIEQNPTRDGFGRGLVEAGEKDEKVVALCADLSESTRMQWFEEKFPERYIEIGVAEQNLATVASGLANYGKIPFIASYAVFSPGRNNEQIRTTISLNNVPVKIVGSHAGVSVGSDGATHQALEDIALMRVQPNMVVLVPADVEEARKATIACAKLDAPVYLRLARAKSPMFTTSDTPFEIGKAEVLFESEKPEVAIIVCGNLVHNALLAANELEKEGTSVTVINSHTIKPMDTKTILKEAKKAGAVVTIEEHQIAGGMGSAVAEVLVQESPMPIEFIGVHNEFGQSGDPNELIEHYGMGVESIKKAVKKVIKRK